MLRKFLAEEGGKGVVARQRREHGKRTLEVTKSSEEPVRGMFHRGLSRMDCAIGYRVKDR